VKYPDPWWLFEPNPALARALEAENRRPPPADWGDMPAAHYHSRAEVLMDRVMDAAACGRTAEQIAKDEGIGLSGLEKRFTRAGHNDLAAWVARARRRALNADMEGHGRPGKRSA
jgi:hypothetical protein